MPARTFELAIHMRDARVCTCTGCTFEHAPCAYVRVGLRGELADGDALERGHGARRRLLVGARDGRKGEAKGW